MISGEKELCYGEEIGIPVCGAGKLTPEFLSSLGRVCGGCLLERVGQQDNENQLLTFENEQLKQETLTDPVTQLFNLRALEQALKLKEQEGQPFGLLFIDLAKFKAVNARLGHDRGNYMLGVTASFLRDQLRSSDSVAFRFGGDEFCVILSEDIDTKDGDRTGQLDLVKRVEAIKQRLPSKYLTSEPIAQYNETYKGVDALGMHIGGKVWEPGMSLSDLKKGADVSKYSKEQHIDLREETSREA